MTKKEFDDLFVHLEDEIDSTFKLRPIEGRVWHGIRGHILNPTFRSGVEDRLVKAGILEADKTAAAPAAPARPPAAPAAPAAS